MDYIETENEIITTISFRGNKAKPGAGFIYFSPELFAKLCIGLDTPMTMRFDKMKKEICLKQLQY